VMVVGEFTRNLLITRKTMRRRDLGLRMIRRGEFRCKDEQKAGQPLVEKLPSHVTSGQVM